LYPDAITQVDFLFEKNPELKKKFQIKKILFALSEIQRNQLLDIAENTNSLHFAMILCGLEGGLRISEIVNLLIQNINFKGKTIEIKINEKTRNVIYWHPKTAKGQRLVPLSDKLAKVLKNIIGKRTMGYVFLSRKGNSRFTNESRINMINRYAKNCNSIDKAIGSHSLRRTYASYLIRKGMDIGTVSKYLGHKSVKTTMIYLYDIVDLDDIDKAVDILNDMNK
jgi:integrase